MENLDHIKNLTDLLEIAINDMRAVKGDKKYRFDPAIWHKKDNWAGECAVCVAGSVIAKTLKTPYGVESCPFGFYGQTQGKLLLLNTIRLGAINHTDYYGCFSMYLPPNFLDIFKSVNKDRLWDGHLTAWKKVYSNAKELGL